ncbi:MAG: DUF2059 domain-containing protein [Ruegeria sp.]|uniref:DUF2059 domain-containing protein n=1 Tax=Ruegeria sp. TaxID=1879320 RepID=UPI00349ECD31
MRLALLTLAAMCVWALPVAADETLDRLAQALRLDEVVEILRDEGLKYGRELDDQMLGGEGGQPFDQQIQRIYVADEMQAGLRKALADGMTAEQRAQAATFFEGDLGQTIISLENSARRAFATPAIEEAARTYYEEIDQQDARFRLVEEYISVNDLVAQNVKGALSADFNFYRGMAEGHGAQRDDGVMLSDLLDQQDETRAETTAWLYGFLLMAYQPLSEAEMRENIAFSRTGAGQALNAALFEGFDAMYDSISYELGLAVALALTATDL